MTRQRSTLDQRSVAAQSRPLRSPAAARPLRGRCRGKLERTAATALRRTPRQPGNPRAASGEPADGLLLAAIAQRLPELDAPARTFLRPTPRTAPGPGLGAGCPCLADQPAGCPGRMALELAGKPIGRADENPAAGPASRPAPDQRIAAAAAASPAERHHINPEHYGSAAFGLSLACMAHERQYSRLFRS
jgi:hypothetical protein